MKFSSPLDFHLNFLDFIDSKELSSEVSLTVKMLFSTIMFLIKQDPKIKPWEQPKD